MIEINGNKYILKPKIKVNNAMLVGLFNLFINAQKSEFQRNLTAKDLIIQYELIQQKRCKHSKSEREYIVKAFNNTFQKITS